MDIMQSLSEIAEETESDLDVTVILSETLVFFLK
jgi:hypothetical protein